MRTLLPRVSSRRPSAFAMFYLIVALSALMLLASLAVDFGHVQMAKTELLAATDAAARYAATGLSDGSYFTKASAVAAQNQVDGTALVLQASDVIAGNWSNNTFTANGTPLNAVCISAQRSVSRGTAIPVLFGLNVNSCNITATSYAMYSAGSGVYGIVGLNSAVLQNNTILTDSYSSASGPYNASTAGYNGGIASNGNINLSGNVTLKGGLYMQANQSLTTNGNVSYGTRSTLTTPLSYAAASAGTISTNNNDSALSPYLQSGNLNFSNGTLHVPAGNYYMNTFSMNGGTLSIDGAANFYINGDFTIQGGTVSVLNNSPSNFGVNIVTAAGANITNQSNLYINLYCPTSPINVNNSANLYGSFIGSSLSVSGSCGLHVDNSLLSGTGGSSGTISTVR